MNPIFFSLALIALAVSSGCNTDHSADAVADISAPRTVVIRDTNGKDLLSESNIVSYDIAQHVFTLKDGIRSQIKPSQSLVGGSPFTMFVDGKPAYSGMFTTSLSSTSLDDVVIDLFPSAIDDNQLRISLGYPERKFYTGDDDPRANSRLIATLRALGKVPR